MRTLADRLNLLRGAAADQNTRKLRQAGFHSRDAAVVFIFIKLALPLVLGFLMILMTSPSSVLEVEEDMILPLCIGAVLAGFEQLAERFLVLYGDTMVNVDFGRLWSAHERGGAEAHGHAAPAIAGGSEDPRA